jgi:hypothetical protein
MEHVKNACEFRHDDQSSLDRIGIVLDLVDMVQYPLNLWKYDGLFVWESVGVCFGGRGCII